VTGEPTEGRALIDLRRRICDAAERVAALETERFALEELCDGLEAKQRDLERRVTGVAREQAELESEREARRARAQELALEADGVRKEILTLEGECSDRTLRAEDLSAEAKAVLDKLRGYRAGGEAVEAELRSVRDTIARMDRKLGCAERKRAAPRAPKRAGESGR
jgi:chromosome segregation ATPase